MYRYIMTVVMLVLLLCVTTLLGDAKADEFLIDTKVIYGLSEGNQTNPKAAYANGVNYLVVWEDKRGVDYDVFGARIDLFGDVIDSAGIPIATGICHQDQPAVAFDGTYYLVVWRENSNLFGVRISTDGLILDASPIAVSTATGDQSNVNLCFGDTTYLVVWQDNRTGGVNDVYGTRIRTEGTVLDPGGIAISTATGGQTFPSVAFGDTNFMVVWGDDRNGVSNMDVYGTRVNQSGTVVEPLGFQIAHDESYNEQRPSIAYNPYLTGCYLVAWEDYRGPTVDIYGTRVFHDGTVMDDPVNIPISTADNTQETPWVCSRGVDFFVVWKDHRNGLYSQTVYGARVDHYGSITDPSGIPLSFSFEFYYPATVIYGVGEYLLVHAYADGTQYDIFGRFIDIDGSITGSVDLARSASSQTYADVAFDGTNYLVVWQSWRYNYDIYGALVDQNGALVDTAIGICTDPDHQYHPQVAFDGTNYFVVWEHRDVDSSHIYGCRVSKQDEILDPAGIPICLSQHYQYHPAVVFDGTNYIVIWDYLHDIYFGHVDTSGIIVGCMPNALTTGYSSENPSVAFGDPYYLIAWEEGMGFPFSDIYAKRVKTNGETVEPTGIPITSMAEAHNPSIAFDGTNYLITWDDNGIYAAQVDTGGTVLGSKGTPLCNNSEAQNADVAFDGSNCLVIWEEGVPESFFDICGAKVSPSGEKIDSFDICTRSENQIQPAVAIGFGEEALVVYSGFADSIEGRSANAMRIWGNFYRFTGIDEELDPGLPISRFELMQNYPNPFNSSTLIQYKLPKDALVEVNVFNILGQLVRTIFSGEQSRGPHTLVWEGMDDQGRVIGSGIYFYQLRTEEGVKETRKMLLLK